MSGLPEDEWSEADIEKLVQPFGTPSGTIIAKQIGKVGHEHDRLGPLGGYPSCIAGFVSWSCLCSEVQGQALKPQEMQIYIWNSFLINTSTFTFPFPRKLSVACLFLLWCCLFSYLSKQRFLL